MGVRTAPRREVAAQAPVEPSPPEARPSVTSTPEPASNRVEVPRPVALRASVVLHGELEPSQRVDALNALRARHDAQCPHCTTATAHTQTVFGEGSPTARLMFIGEAPGENEDRTGRPFVGRAGEKLDEMIAAMGLNREQVYIANVLKSRPPDNRTPLQHEVDGCGPFLIEQILIVRPEVIVTLGGPATKLVLGTEEGITRLRGTWSEWAPPAGGLPPIPVMPTYHPAYLLRNYTPKTRGEVWADLKAVMGRLGRPAGSARN
jgi:DNA polymerase